ncbi:anaphase-promoting complex subunit Cut9 [Ascochyta clinopodiicola]|nr:anaphase-promoting complex subunit Cut9 [Ascochyta clinopodiicola]
MEKYLREWRQDAVNRHQYDTAIFVADKLLAITDDDQDAFWLAQVHFSTGNYQRAQSLLARGNLADSNAQCRYLAAHCAVKLGRLDDALLILGDKNPAHLVAVAGSGSARQKLRHVDVHARHPKAAARNERLPTSEERDGEAAANLKSEAAMCYLRGVCFAKQNSFDRAKDCYKTAVHIDVQCFEAFDALMANSLMAPDEEWAFLDSLDFDSIAVAVAGSPSLAQEAAHFTRQLYTTRLSKYARPHDFATATETLSTHYHLAANPDMLLSRADLMYTHCRFRDALALTSSVLAADQHNFAILPLHTAALYELGEKNALFLLAHNLSDSNPDEPAAWLAVGVYYLAANRIADARRYFSKASVMDPHYGPAWIGFAHTFAAEGEHDQAISAYSTAARLFQGTHLPQLFLGMQNLQLNNLTLAREYLNAAFVLCDTDPLLLNEMAVVAFHETDHAVAISLLQRALSYAQQNEADPETTIPTRINLAHALRRNGALEESLRAFDDVLRHGVKDPNVLTAKGLVLLELDRSLDAVTVLHEALAISPQDPMATDLLNRALEANETDSGVSMLEPAQSHNGQLLLEDEVDDRDFEEALKRRKNALRDMEPNRVAGRRRRGRRHAAGFVDEESGMGESMLVDSDA